MASLLEEEQPKGMARSTLVGTQKAHPTSEFILVS